MKQLRVAGSQVKGVQSMVSLPWQLPMPSQVLGLLRVGPVQEAGTHTVPPT